MDSRDGRWCRDARAQALVRQGVECMPGQQGAAQARYTGKAARELVARVPSPLGTRVARACGDMFRQLSVKSRDGLHQRRHDALLVSCVEISHMN